MARTLRIEYPGAFYHVTCRGNEQRPIFKDDPDRRAFLSRLQISLENYGVTLHAYVLMNNHFHFVVETPSGNVSEFMRHFNVTYTGYFNWRHRRVGHLYQGRFKAILVEADSHLLELSRYVHLNPVRVMHHREKSASEKVQYCVGYKWSSLPGYLGRYRERFVEYRRILDYVGGDREKGCKAYGQFVEGGIHEAVKCPWEQVSGQVLLGRETFVKEMRQYLKGRKIVVREQPVARALARRGDTEGLIHEVARILGKKAEELCKRGGGIERAIVMESLHRYGQVNQREIGKRLGGVDYSWVSRMRGELRQVMKKDEGVRNLFQRVDEALLDSQVKI